MQSEQEMKPTLFSAQRVMSMTTASLLLGLTSLPAQAIPWRDLFIRGTQVIQLQNISPRQEVALGAQMHQNLLSRGVKLNRDPFLNDYLNRVGSRITRYTQRPNIPYQYYVVQDNAVNAFATSGGYLYVTTGLMKAADNEAQLASVVAHEAAHIDQRHLVNQLRQSTLTRGIASSVFGSRSALAGIGVDLLVNRPKGRNDEYDADEKGLRILRDAGYATSEMTAFMSKLISSRSSPTFLSTHPAVPDRLKSLDKMIAEGPQNECDRAQIPASCGVNDAEYQATIQSRL